MNITFLILPVTGALIGWLTNLLAIKSLFQPREPIRFAFFTVQGLLPKRQQELAFSIGQIVEGELVTAEALTQRLQTEEVKEKIVEEILAQTEAALIDKLPRILQGVGLLDLILPLVHKEAGPFLDKLLLRAEELVKKEARVGEIVEAKVNSFDVGRLEELVLTVAGRELRHIELLGAVLGALIGLFQAFLVQII